MKCPHCGKLYKRQSAFDKHVSAHTNVSEDERKREACLKFQKNPTVNPYTGRAIKINGAVYKNIDKQCKDMLLRFQKDTTVVRPVVSPVVRPVVSPVVSPVVKPVKPVRPMKKSSKSVTTPPSRVSRFITKRIQQVSSIKPSMKPYTFDPNPYFKTILVNLGQSPRSNNLYLKDCIDNYQRLSVHIQQLPTHERMRFIYSLALVAIIAKFEVDVNNVSKDRVINDTILRVASQQGTSVSKVQLIHAEREIFERLMSLK
jgi:hypothetical protein